MDAHRIELHLHNGLSILVRTNKHPRKLGQSRAIGYKNKLHSPATDLEALIEAFGQQNVHTLVDAIVNMRKQHPSAVFKIEHVL